MCGGGGGLSTTMEKIAAEAVQDNFCSNNFAMGVLHMFELSSLKIGFLDWILGCWLQVQEANQRNRPCRKQAQRAQQAQAGPAVRVLKDNHFGTWANVGSGLSEQMTQMELKEHGTSKLIFSPLCHTLKLIRVTACILI